MKDAEDEMKILSYSLYLSCCLCLTVSINALASRLFSPTTYTSYEDAKKDFDAKNLYEKLDFEGATKWFKKASFEEDFVTYFEARDFFQKKGYLKPVEKLYDGSGQFSFVRDGEEVNKKVLNDVIITLFLSNFVYALGTLRKQTKLMAFTEEELKKEVAIGDSFDQRNYTPEVMKSYEASQENGKNKKFDPKGPMVKLMSGNLKVSKDPTVRTPEVNMAQLQDVLRHKDYQSVSKTFANELTVTALHSFKTNKLFIYKFDAKYNKSNLVYSIAGRERKNGQNLNENETDLYLAFRGSSTARDWIQNVQAPLIDVLLRQDANSGKCYLVEQMTYQKIEIEKTLHDKLTEVVEEAGENIRVHRGFLSYLFADRGENGEVDADKDNDSMYTNIRLNIWRLLEQTSKTTNTLYVTGHSLGGALATLASFFLTCDKEINNRNSDWRGVKCISFASPIVGNVSFQRAFEVLQSKEQFQSTTAKTSEGERLFRNIRVTNNRDMVPLVPFFSKYRHAAGVNVHLNRPSALSLWKPRKPKIEAQTAHWKSMWSAKHPYKIFHPTSLITGLFATTLKFFGLITTTIPILLVVPYLLIQPFLQLFPPLSQFQQIGILKPLFGAIASFANIPNVKMGLVLASWALVTHLFTKKKTSTAERAALICAGVPLVASMTRLFANKSYYMDFAKFWRVYFLVGIAGAQILTLLTRKPLEVMKFQTHSLSQYYAHLRPFHPLVSSSQVIVDGVSKDLED